jgi:hypothetical protein
MGCLRIITQILFELQGFTINFLRIFPNLQALEIDSAPPKAGPSGPRLRFICLPRRRLFRLSNARLDERKPRRPSPRREIICLAGSSPAPLRRDGGGEGGVEVGQRLVIALRMAGGKPGKRLPAAGYRRPGKESRRTAPQTERQGVGCSWINVTEPSVPKIRTFTRCRTRRPPGSTSTYPTRRCRIGQAPGRCVKHPPFAHRLKSCAQGRIRRP